MPRRKTRTESDVQRFAAVLTELGLSAERQLSWVLDFARRDLRGLTAAERAQLSDFLRVLAVSPASMPKTLPPEKQLHLGSGPLPAHQLCLIQEDVKGIITEMTRKDGAPVQLAVSHAIVQRNSDATINICLSAPDAHASVLLAIAGILAAASRHLRTCSECGSPFVARKRQEYCSVRCSQRARNLRTGRIKDPTQRREL